MKLSDQSKIQRGIDLCQEITDIQNDIIREEGGIEIDNQRLWQGWLHQRSNDDWEAIFTVLAELYDHMSPSQARLIQEAIAYYIKNCKNPRCMDRNPKYKKPAWQSIMVIREVMNSIAGVYVPNRPLALV